MMKILEKEILSDYKTGNYSVGELVDMYDVDYLTIVAMITINGLPTLKEIRTKKEEAKIVKIKTIEELIIDDYENTPMLVSEIAKRYNVDYAKVNCILLEHRRKQNRY